MVVEVGLPWDLMFVRVLAKRTLRMAVLFAAFVVAALLMGLIANPTHKPIGQLNIHFGTCGDSPALL